MKNRYPEYNETFEQDFRAQHKRTKQAEKFTFHIHSHFELLFLPVGGACLETAKGRYDPPRNSLLIFNGMDLHHVYPASEAEYDRYVAYFKPEYIAPLSTPQTNLLECFYFRPFETPQILPLTDGQADEVLRTLERTCAFFDAPERFGQDLRGKLILAELLLTVNACYRQYHSISAVSSRSYERIYRVVNYIHRNYTQELSLDTLSSRFYINKPYLCKLFKEVTGSTVNQYVINCRMMKARQLLADGVPVDEVCGRVGCRNLSHFSRTFKRLNGQSPKKYQLSNGNGGRA